MGCSARGADQTIGLDLGFRRRTRESCDYTPLPADLMTVKFGH